MDKNCGCTCNVAKSDYYIDPVTKRWMIKGIDTGEDSRGEKGDQGPGLSPEQTAIIEQVPNKVDKEEQKSLVANNLILKLEEDYTKSEIDEKIALLQSDTLGYVTTSQTLAQLNALANGVYQAQTEGLYANGLTAKVGYTTKFKKQGTSWDIYSEVKIDPIFISDDVTATGSFAVSQKGVYNYVSGTKAAVEAVIVKNVPIVSIVAGTTVGLLQINNTVDPTQTNWKSYVDKDRGTYTHVHYKGNCPINGRPALIGIRADNTIVTLIPLQTTIQLLDSLIEIPADVVKISSCARNLTTDVFILELVKYEYQVKQSKVEGLPAIKKSVDSFNAMSVQSPTEVSTVQNSGLVVGIMKREGNLDTSFVNWRSFVDVPVSSYNRAYFKGVTPNSNGGNITAIGKRADNSVVVLREDTTITYKEVYIEWPDDVVKISVSYRATTGDTQFLQLQKTIIKINEDFIAGTKKINLSTIDVGNIGTSITKYSETGQNGRGYTDQIQDYVNFKSVEVWGYPGHSFAVNTKGQGNIASKINEWTKKDYYTLEGATNDFRLDVPIGTINDYTAAIPDATTFYGALRIIIDRLYSLNQNAVRTFFGSGHRDLDGYDTYHVNGAGHTLIDYLNAMEIVANRESIPMIRLDKSSNMSIKNISYYTTDKLHYNFFGYAQMTYVWLDIIKTVFPTNN